MPTTYGNDIVYCLKSHCGVRGYCRQKWVLQVQIICKFSNERTCKRNKDVQGLSCGFEVQVSYDGNIGWSNVYKMPSMLTAKQYMEVQDQVAYNNGGSAYDWSKYISSDLLTAYKNGTNSGTNWLDAIRNKNAVSSSHALNITGGNELSKFSTGVGYQYQDGVFGNMAKSDFRRFTFHLNSEHISYRNSQGLDVVKIGENVYFQHKQNQGIQIGNQYSNVISTALRANPCIPVYNSDGVVQIISVVFEN